mmetsp:Transcript_29251/g.70496  ORF Transcript_29251/g.70496 Transcript_29251/m.70496 type:complete len:143 (-) Transcript_29251:142-570(-)
MSSNNNPVLLFLVVGQNEPLYEAEIHKRGGTGNSDAVARQNYFVTHSALDLVEKAQWVMPSMYLRVVDKVNNQLVSAFLTAGNTKFLLLHGGKSDDSIRNFFYECHELYVKMMMNPFYNVDTPIASKEFDKRVRNAARRYLQ